MVGSKTYTSTQALSFRILVAAVALLLLGVSLGWLAFSSKDQAYDVQQWEGPAQSVPTIEKSPGEQHSSSVSLELVRRAPEEVDANAAWNHAIDKARELICAWRNPNTTPSPFMDVNDLKKWGWVENEELGHTNEYAVRGAFNDMGFPLAYNELISMEHGERRVITEPAADAGTYNPTEGFYVQDFNFRSGTIVVNNIRSPEKEVERTLKDGGVFEGPLPKLRRWSDVTFLIMQMLNDEYISQGEEFDEPYGHLQWVFHTSINNRKTLAIMELVLGDYKDAIGPWPGRKFSVKTAEGKALLGSPNCSGTGYLLAQHPEQFRGKVISEIIIWDDGRHGTRRPGARWSPHLAMHIVNAPEGFWDSEGGDSEGSEAMDTDSDGEPGGESSSSDAMDTGGDGEPGRD